MDRKRLIKIFCHLVIYVSCAYSFVHSMNWYTRVSAEVGISGFNYDRYRSTFKRNEFISHVKNILPERVKFETTEPDQSYLRVLARYVLYPSEISSDWSYLVDWPKEGIKKVGFEKMKIMPVSGGIVYAKDGADFVKESRDKPDQSLIRVLTAVAIVSFLYFSIGFLILTLFKIPFKNEGVFWLLSTGYLSGFFVLNSALWLLMILGFNYSRNTIVLCWGALLLGLIVIVGANLKKQLNELFLAMGRAKQSIFNPLGIVLFLIFIMGALQPVFGWDSMSQWMLKAKIFFFQGSMDLSYAHQNYYPLLWSLNGANHFTMLNSDYDAVTSWMTAIVFVMFWVQFIGALKTLKLPRGLFSLPILLGILFYMDDNQFQPNAELMFWALSMGAIGCVLKWLDDRDNKGYLFLAVIMAWGVGLVKFEGFITSIVMGVALFLLSYRQKPLRLYWKTFSLFFMSAPFILVWYTWVNFNGHLGNVSHFQDRVSILKMGYIVYYVFEAFWLQIFLGAGIFLMGFRKSYKYWNESEKFLFIMAVGLIGFSLVAVGGWPLEMLEGMIEYAYSRLFLHGAMALILWWCSLNRDIMGVNAEKLKGG